mgnify:CR=1 FL=1
MVGNPTWKTTVTLSIERDRVVPDVWPITNLTANRHRFPAVTVSPSQTLINAETRQVHNHLYHQAEMAAPEDLRGTLIRRPIQMSALDLALRNSIGIRYRSSIRWIISTPALEEKEPKETVLMKRDPAPPASTHHKVQNNLRTRIRHS